MSAAKRHHWWPECHSKLWVAQNGLITMINKEGVAVPVTPENAGIIKHHNSVRLPDGSVDISLETYFADEIEGPVAPILSRLATERFRSAAWDRHIDHNFAKREAFGIRQDGFLPIRKGYSVSLPPKDKLAAARYFASLLVRVPSYKDELKSTQMVAGIQKILGLSEEDAKIETDILHVEIVHRHLEDYATRLLQCAWVLIESEKQEIIFGDTPVVPSALGWGEAEAICPVSPNRCLMLVRGYKPPIEDAILIVQSLPRSIRALNCTLLQNANRFIFCRSPFPLDFVRTHLGTRQARIKPIFSSEKGTRIDGPMLGE